MAKALEREMSDFFGRQYDEAWKVDGNEIAKLYCAPTVTVRADGSIHCLQSQNELARFFQWVLGHLQKPRLRWWDYARPYGRSNRRPKCLGDHNVENTSC